MCESSHHGLGFRLMRMHLLKFDGGMFPIGSSSRRLLNQSTQSRVANSTLRQGPRRRMISDLNRPMMVSARALSYESPTLPTEDSIPASRSRSV